MLVGEGPVLNTLLEAGWGGLECVREVYAVVGARLVEPGGRSGRVGPDRADP